MLSPMSAEDHSIAARLKAARALAGLSVHQLSDLMPTGLKRGTIQLIEAGGRDLDPGEAITLAKACKIDPRFFIADLTDMSNAPADLPGTELDPETAKRVQAARDQLKRLRG